MAQKVNICCQVLPVVILIVLELRSKIKGQGYEAQALNAP